MITEQKILQFKTLLWVIVFLLISVIGAITNNSDALRETIKAENWKLMQCLGDKTKCEVVE